MTRETDRNYATRTENTLIDALRENLSPHAVAVIASYLQATSTNNPQVDREVQWFVEQLVRAVGGWDRQNSLAEEVGL